MNKRIWRALRENFAQYTGSVVLIILSCMLFTGMTVVSANLQRLSTDFERQNAQEDATFTTLQPVADLPALEAAGDAVIEEGRMLDTPLSEGVTLRIFSQNEKLNLPAVLEGQALRGGDILLHPVFARAHGYKIGDVITVFDRPFTIAGYGALPNYIYPLRSDTDMVYSPQAFGIGVITKADFAALNQGNTFYAVKFNQPDAHPRAQSARFRDLLRSQGAAIGQWTDIGDNQRVTFVRLKNEAIDSMSKVMPTSLLLLTSLLIGGVLARLISRESAVIGALYALGYRRAEIYRHYLIFPLIIALGGGILGTALGLLIVQPILGILIEAFTIPVPRLDFSPILLLVSVLLPVLFLGISSLLVLRKELRHSPVELMKGDQAKTGVNLLERTLKLDRLNFTLKFQLREQLRSLSRLAFLLAGCAAATMLLLYGFTIYSSVDYLINHEMTGVYHFEYEYQYKEVQYAPPPEGVEAFSADRFLAEGDEKTDFYLSGVMPNSKLLSFVDGSGAPLSTDQVIITRALANKLEVKEGDTLNLIRKVDDRAFALQIDRIAETYVGKYIFMPLEAFNRTFEMPEGSYLGLWSPRALDIPKDRLYNTKSIDGSIAAIKELTQPIQSMIVTYAAIAFIIGLIVIYLVTSMIVEENRTSISLLKIFGYHKKEVNTLVLNSSTLGVVVGYLLGVPLILASIGGLLESLDNSVGITLPVQINPWFILAGFVVVMLTFELSKRMCKKKVDGIPMSEALKLGME